MNAQTEQLAVTANKLCIRLGQHLIILKDLHSRGASGRDRWRLTRHVICQLNGIVYAASQLLSPAEFANFLAASGVGAEMAEQAHTQITQSLQSEN